MLKKKDKIKRKWRYEMLKVIAYMMILIISIGNMLIFSVFLIASYKLSNLNYILVFFMWVVIIEAFIHFNVATMIITEEKNEC